MIDSSSRVPLIPLLQVEFIRVMPYREFVQNLNIEIPQKYLEKIQDSQLYFFKIRTNKGEWEIRRTKEELDQLHNPSKVMNYADLLNNMESSPQKFAFLELSHMPQIRKFKEGYLQKQAGSRHGESRCPRWNACWGLWQKRYFSISADSILYSKSPDSPVSDCQNFHVGLYFDVDFPSLQVRIHCMKRHLLIRAKDQTQFLDFVYALQQAIQNSAYTKPTRFGSFAPQNTGSCVAYADGKDYFSDLYESLRMSKSIIYITGWWVSPEFYLKRPLTAENEASRLDRILKERADNGVQIFILVYNEFKLALNNDSQHTKEHLESLSQNIKVLRHPQFTVVPPLFSHHEKLVIIDEKEAFMGGLDICFGRMDDCNHNLFQEENIWPGIDFSNSRVKDFVDVKKNHDKTLLTEGVPRMPWHDIAIKVSGEVVNDLVMHFIQYWNHVVIDKNFQQRHELHLFKQESGQNSNTDLNTSDNQNDDQINDNQQVSVQELTRLNATQPKQIVKKPPQRVSQIINQYWQDIKTNGSQKDSQDQIMPPKNNKILTRGSEVIKRTNKQEYISQRSASEWNETSRLADDFQNLLKNPSRNRQSVNLTYLNKGQSFTIPDNNHFRELFAIPKQFADQTMSLQVLRSASQWSIGLEQNNTEQSILIAYMKLIACAKTHIYIENQFFISCSADQQVLNLIAECLIERIRIAHNRQENFKVVVFIPLLPGFEGEITDPNSTILKIQLHFEYKTIRNLLSAINEFCDQPEKYIKFYSLRKHEKGKTEIIYIHSKLMIVDDEWTIIGSANINDRSMLGDRDSELALLIQNQEFSSNLRKKLYMEHFNLDLASVKNADQNALNALMSSRARDNTIIYRQIFGCYPDDNIRTISQVNQLKSEAQPELYSELVCNIKGHAVQFPLNFLIDEDLSIGFFNKEIMCPIEAFT